MKILILDDDPDISEILKDICESFGAKPVVCDSGEEALDTLKEQHFDLIFSDIFMPKMDGIEFTEAVRKLGITIPIIIISAGGRRNIEAFNRALKHGATELLEKPFGISEIKDLFDKYKS